MRRSRVAHQHASPGAKKQGHILCGNVTDMCQRSAGVQGIAFPAVHSLLSTSVPRGFQSTGVAIVTAASYGGAAFAAGVAPWIIHELRWPAVFYAFGASALLWLPFWIGITPSQHAKGTEAQSALEPGSSRRGGEASTSGREPSRAEGQGLLDVDADGGACAPVLNTQTLGLDRAFWGLAKRREVWAICVAQYCQSWGMYALLNWLPTFFSEQVRIRSRSACPCRWALVHRDHGTRCCKGKTQLLCGMGQVLVAACDRAGALLRSD
jgi:MFS family permease